MATTDIFRTQLPSRLRLAMCRFSSTFPPTKIHSRSLSFSWANTQHTRWMIHSNGSCGTLLLLLLVPILQIGRCWLWLLLWFNSHRSWLLVLRITQIDYLARENICRFRVYSWLSCYSNNIAFSASRMCFSRASTLTFSQAAPGIELVVFGL